MSLYTHVPGKSELTDLMFDTVYADLYADVDEPTRQAGLSALRSLRERGARVAMVLCDSGENPDARPDGELGYFSKQWRVYGREGEPCLCGAPVQRRVDSGRSTFFCAKCQKG